MLQAVTQTRKVAWPGRAQAQPGDDALEIADIAEYIRQCFEVEILNQCSDHLLPLLQGVMAAQWPIEPA